MIVLHVSLNFDTVKELYDVSSYFNDESNYSEENESDSEDFCSTYLQPFQFEPEKEKK